MHNAVWLSWAISPTPLPATNRRVLNQIQDSYHNRQHEHIFTSKLEHSLKKKKKKSSLIPLIANNAAPAKWTQKNEKDRQQKL